MVGYARGFMDLQFLNGLRGGDSTKLHPVNVYDTYMHTFWKSENFGHVWSEVRPVPSALVTLGATKRERVVKVTRSSQITGGQFAGQASLSNGHKSGGKNRHSESETGGRSHSK